ncbi:TIGR00341 family protein [Novosphingobium umbonatum]|uniref:TIGR00341 family protein n=1 Tax=Novosphingobium umbonatum TaxID=1908524 RepID=UPI001FEC9B97|nr:TIGR00341 family protein [Novosphingobium umbonatum]
MRLWLPPHGLIRWWRDHVNAEIDHPAVVQRIFDESGWSPRFIFMVVMSAGIAELGLLQSSPAVVIGAMLISPLMGPIMGLGFGLALFDFASLRRSLAALALAVPLAIAFTALIVLCSPLQSATPEILARTQPNLFDLVIALFSALAGSFALIRGKGETIVGVAIATALMPPLATVGFGLATGNSAIAWGALALFATNFVTIALSATIMARLYGFGHYLSTHQTWLQTGLLLGAFVAMAVPLGLSLEHIASQAVTTNQIRAALAEASGREARITQLDIDFQAVPIAVRTVIITPRQKAVSTAQLANAIKARIGQAVALQADQVWRAPSSSGLDDAKAALARAQDLQMEERHTEHIRYMLAIAAGAAPDDVLIDREAHRAQVAAVLLPGADLATYHALEQHIAALADGWTVMLAPPAGLNLLPVPVTGNGQLSSAAMAAVETNIWAAKRWNWAALGIPGWLAAMPAHPSSLQAEAKAIGEIASDADITPVAGGKYHAGILQLAPIKPNTTAKGA